MYEGEWREGINIRITSGIPCIEDEVIEHYKEIYNKKEEKDNTIHIENANKEKENFINLDEEKENKEKEKSINLNMDNVNKEKESSINLHIENTNEEKENSITLHIEENNKENSIILHEENIIPKQSIVIDTKEGWLQKESRYRKKWRNRWCVLDSNTFSTYENENKTKATERIEVRTITMVGNEFRKNCFCFVSISIIIYSLLK